MKKRLELQLQEFVKNCSIVHEKQCHSFLNKIGCCDEQKREYVISIAVKHQLIYKEEFYLVAAPFISRNKNSDGLRKAIWLYLEQMENIEFYSFEVKIPSCLLFLIKETDQIYNVFYIPEGKEAFSINLINTCCGQNQKQKNNAIVIIDSYAQISKISLAQNFNIHAFIVVDEGDIDEIDPTKKIEVYKNRKLKKGAK